MATSELSAGTGQDKKGDSHVVAAATDFLRTYQRASATTARDALEGRYQVSLSTPLPEFDRKQARGFAATDMIDVNRRLVALVCQTGALQRHALIRPLKDNPHPHLMKLVAAGVVSLSQPAEERFVVIYERPAGKKLSELLAASKGISEDYVCKHIIAPILAAINHMSTFELSHGSINPDNIYFDEMAVLGDCITEPCGLSQPFYYEPLYRMQAHPAAKGEGSVAHDIYALAVLAMYALKGSQHFTRIEPETLLRRIMHEGPADALMGSSDFSEKFTDYFRGCLTLATSDRWNYQNVKSWLEGKRFNMLHLPPPVEAARPFEFAEAHASTRREMAHLMATHWSLIPSIIESGQLVQWISVSLRNKELAENVQRLCKSALDFPNRNDPQFSEQLMRIIILLDPPGPIRIGMLSMHADGIDSLASAFFMGNAEKELQLLVKFIEYDMIGFWLEHQKKQRHYAPQSTVNAMLLKLDKLRMCIRNAGLGFGPERLLYDLNPEMPCLSRHLSGYYVTGMDALLMRLDQLAPSLHKSDDPIDRHIAAFITSKLNIQHEVRVPELSGLPTLAVHRAIVALKLLSQAQSRVVNLSVPGLTHWLAVRILPALDVVRSKTIRNRLKIELVQQASTGSLFALSDLVFGGAFATADRDGYELARRTYNHNIKRIDAFRKGAQLGQKSDALGYKLSQLIAYIVLGLTVFHLYSKIGT
jgi:eukaryotic-like serine/threonine-protein kinase